MWSERRLLTLVLLLCLCSCCPSTSPNGTPCPSNCNVCTNNMTCTQCCWGSYFIAPGAACQTCSLAIAYCSQCSNASVCQICQYGYGVNNGGTCDTSNENNVQQCTSVNNCNLNNTCLDSWNRYAVYDGICRRCNTVWYMCNRCNTTTCFDCMGSYSLNTTSGLCVTCNSIPNCINCQNGPTCYSCSGPYFASNGFCTPCRYPCAQCTSLTQCSTCADNNYIYANNSCIRCWEHPDFTNCTQCNNSGGINKCYGCVDGFYLSTPGDTCIACSPPCLTCASTSSSCNSCDSQAYVLSGTSCGFCNVSLTNCTKCYNAFVCIQCNPYTLVNFSSPSTASCILCNLRYPHCQTCNVHQCDSCLQGYALNSDHQCYQLPCTSPCLACKTNDSTLCLSCIQSYYYDNSTTTCYLCPLGCSTCTSPTYCTSCQYNYVLQLNNTCQTCPLGQFYTPFGKICQICPIQCLSCDQQNCFTCQQYYQMKINQNGIQQCRDICGDGVVVQDQCDGGGETMEDGCSQDCKIKDFFNCTYTPFSGSATISQCSYIGQIDVQFKDAEQHLFANTITLTYQISPYLKGLPTASHPDNITNAVYQLQSTHNLSNLITTVDQTSGTVSFTFDYSEDLTPAMFTFNIKTSVLSAPTLRYLPNTTTHSIKAQNLQNNGCLGQHTQQSQLQQAQMVYYCSVGLAFVSLVLMIIGTFTKELAALEQTILLQTIFISLLFTQDKVTMPLLALSGLKYSLGVKFPLTNAEKVSSSAYLLATQQENLTNYYLFNFLLFLLPLGALIFLLYRLRHKNFPFKAEQGRHAQQFFRGELLLYIVLFNLFPLIAYSRLFLTLHISHFSDTYFWDLLLAIISVMLTLFAFMNYCIRPQIVGIFRSAFRAVSGQRVNESEQKCRLLTKCVSKRFCQSYFEQCYAKYIPNHYFLFISYMLVSGMVMASSLELKKTILLALQGIVWLVLVAIKPYFNPAQKFRSIFMFSILILSNFVNYELMGPLTIAFVLVGSCALHALITGYVIIFSFVDQIKRKCNDRSEVVKRMFKMEEQFKATNNIEKEEIQKSALNQIIARYNKLQDQGLYPPVNLIDSARELKKHEVEEEQQNKQTKSEKNANEEKQLNEEEIIREEHQHLRYQRGLNFFYTYGKDLSQDFVKNHYGEI